MFVSITHFPREELRHISRHVLEKVKRAQKLEVGVLRLLLNKGSCAAGGEIIRSFWPTWTTRAVILLQKLPCMIT
jgi:hypothetical protein